jgi:CRISPR-associated protein Cmr1
MAMTQFDCRITFVTPAFLGNAEQSGQWRTPPFKALLRQWWRVVFAANHYFKADLAVMRREEGLLFGHAWLEDDRDEAGVRVAARRSRVRLRLDVPERVNVASWAAGTQKGVAPLAAGLETSYAWFGLVKRGAGLPDRTAIRPGGKEGTRMLRMSFPPDRQSDIETTLRLINAFGHLGSRSRGGWGSVIIDGFDLESESVHRFTQRLEECVTNGWAMSLARDSRGPAIWDSKDGYASWDKAMAEVAAQRKHVRTTLKSAGGQDLRSALGFAGSGRMPSPLRWKLFRRPEGSLGIRVFAMPCAIPAESGKNMTEQKLKTAWVLITRTIDASPVFARAYAN